MRVEEHISKDLMIPEKLLHIAGITKRAQIIIENGELHIKSLPSKPVVESMVGIGKKIQPDKDSVTLQRELRKEWKI